MDGERVGEKPDKKSTRSLESQRIAKKTKTHQEAKEQERRKNVRNQGQRKRQSNVHRHKE